MYRPVRLPPRLHLDDFAGGRVNEFAKDVFLRTKMHALLGRTLSEDDGRSVGVPHALTDKGLEILLQSLFDGRYASSGFCANDHLFEAQFRRLHVLLFSYIICKVQSVGGSTMNRIGLQSFSCHNDSIGCSGPDRHKCGADILRGILDREARLQRRSVPRHESVRPSFGRFLKRASEP